MLSPSRRPAGSTSGPPEEPRGSGAVCSIEPPMRRPRGPRKRAAGRRDEPEGHAQAAPARVGEREHRRADAPSAPTRSGSHATAGASPVSTATTATSRSGSAPATRPCSRAPVAERDRDLLAAQHVRVGEHAPGRDHDARSRGPSRARGPTTDGPDRAPRPSRDRLPAARRGVTCSLQVTIASRTSPSSPARSRRASRRVRAKPKPCAARPRSPTRSRASATAGRCSWSPRCSTGPSASTSSRRSSSGIAPNVLTARLKALDRAGARRRAARTPSARRASSTSSSESGRELAGALRLLADWGARAPAAASRCRHDACGGALEARWWCPACEEPSSTTPTTSDVVYV